jgi:superkiller protein 3
MQSGIPGDETRIFNDSSNVRLVNDQGVAYLRQGEYDKAIVQFQMALALNPLYVRAHFNLALLYYRQGLVDREIEEYQEALQIDPDYFNAHLNLGHAYLASGHPESAAREYQWVLTQDPDHRQAIYNLAIILMDRQKNAEADDLFKRYLRLDPSGPWADKVRTYLSRDLKGEAP